MTAAVTHGTAAALTITELCVEVPTSGRRIVDGVSLRLQSGQIGALVGESGSGKSTVALAVLGYTKAGARITSGNVQLGDTEVLRLAPRELRRVQRERVSYVPQDPGTALNPALRLRTQFARVLAARSGSREDHLARVRTVLRAVSLPDSTQFLRRYPQELSGGQQQRVLIAMAVLGDPDVIVWDEPTTGLDVVTKHEILRLIHELCTTRTIAGLYISHDLAAVATLADTVNVMQHGRIVEQGAAARLLRAPEHTYTRQLLAAVPSLRVPVQRTIAKQHPKLLDTAQLAVAYGSTRALHELTFELRAGECLALVGESGSGKSTLSKTLAGLHGDGAGAATSGQIRFEGTVLPISVAKRTQAQRNAMQYVFQNPYGSFQPRRNIGDSISLAARSAGRDHSTAAVAAALQRVGLNAEHAQRYPDECSGGERQRAALARALICAPKLILCDEITSALDVSIQAQIIELLLQLMHEGLALLFVTHDLAVAKALAQRVVVLRHGQVVEQGDAADIFESPSHPYTRLLIEHSSSVEHALAQRQLLDEAV